MTGCVICQQTQERRFAIEGDLRSGLATKVIAMRYHLPMKAIEVHDSVCMMAKVSADTAGAVVIWPHEANGRSSPPVTENPLSQFKQAWQLAQGDPRLQASMLSWLNEQLQAPDSEVWP